MNDTLITKTEFEREWLDLRAVQEVSGGVALKTIRNWTDRDYIKIRNKNPGTNEKRLYSLKNAVEISTMYHMVADGKTGRVARLLADKVIEYANGLFESGISSNQLLDSEKVMLYLGVPGEDGSKFITCEPTEIIKWLETPMQSAINKAVGSGPINFHVFHIEYLIRRCIEMYLEQDEANK